MQKAEVRAADNYEQIINYGCTLIDTNFWVPFFPLPSVLLPCPTPYIRGLKFLHIIQAMSTVPKLASPGNTQ